MNNLFVKKGDHVVVLTGKDKGKKGKIVEVAPKEGKVIVEHCNMVTKHVKPKKQGDQGGIVKAEGPLYACKVQLFCKKCDKGVRAGVRTLEDGGKVRYCKKCNEEL